MERFAAKAALRTRIKIALKQLQCSERTRQSIEVTKKVLAHPKYASSRGIAVFLSMNDEIDTSNIVRDIFDSGKHCFIPRYQESDGHMTMIRMHTYEELESLPRTKWNIPQPSKIDQREDCLQTGGLDLILTPGLAFTNSGHRLGRGKGFYDKFLITYSSVYKPPYLIGLALTPSIVDSIPCTLNDFKMDEILYDNLVNH
ncbi:hypothetical protein DAPPUDRAFT_187016 [Daphnia pulex]|uniref:5-formyltetrahydrofolate cyclo-ligase n=1 Tax=Daphnia pulex TaxID=6669 RepID=E9FSQ6_DAPPU|nr:hypothetical protein DAPPUDRAFT_187016 [Daphnia pulex]|eukprot:EFX89781.1 hypothetical protein DAPPUDRAFT_187016 [Daphnia pulex]